MLIYYSKQNFVILKYAPCMYQFSIFVDFMLPKGTVKMLGITNAQDAFSFKNTYSSTVSYI